MDSLIWFRNDLRVFDNKALNHAFQEEGRLYAIYCICEDQWREHDYGDPKIHFMLSHVLSLKDELSKLNVDLEIYDSKTFKQSINDVLSLASKKKVGQVFFNEEVEVNERLRDVKFKEVAQNKGLEVRAFQDSCILRPGRVRTLQDTPYCVFTPYKKRWTQLFEESDWKMAKKLHPHPQEKVGTSSLGAIPGLLKKLKVKRAWGIGEEAALEKLDRFLRSHQNEYSEARDFPDVDGTSSLSPYLACGVISPRYCYLKSKKKDGGEGGEVWRSELIWREFYRHLLVDYPRLSKGRAFKLQTENLAWRYDEDDVAKFKNAETGIPIVDAAIRQLLETHWMHNRLRMVVAMFFTKNLRLHWSIGETFFMNHLVDADLAANNGGWQWSASTGCDAAPYFRIFNPLSQSKRFDPEAKFIKSFLPELENLSAKDCHAPHEKGKNLFALDYPDMMVDLKSSREAALKMFKESPA